MCLQIDNNKNGVIFIRLLLFLVLFLVLFTVTLVCFYINNITPLFAKSLIFKKIETIQKAEWLIIDNKTVTENITLSTNNIANNGLKICKYEVLNTKKGKLLYY